ncbi:MAG: hypothetical protein Q7O66_04730 [Dehalococcoidia bacterium]|nr:hypothetical protein [Dehalococcoidia bacterium]
MVGAWGLWLRLTEMDKDQLSLIGKLIDRYESSRPLISSGGFYHLVGLTDINNPWGGGWFVVESYDQEAGKGAVLYVHNGENSPQSITPQLRGLDAGLRYRLWTIGNEGSTSDYGGSELLATGLSLAAEPRQGNWILFQRE